MNIAGRPQMQSSSYDHISMKRPHFLILPHVPMIGGAGLYNRAAIAFLAQAVDITLMGDAAGAYASIDNAIRIADTDLPARPILPAYAGASWRAFLFHAARAPLRVVAVWRWARRHASILSDYDAILVTSSIDLSFLYGLYLAGIRSRRICIVQENAFLSGGRGLLNQLLLRSIDTVVSISGVWSQRAALHGIASIVAANPFSIPDRPSPNDAAAENDLIFVGGSSRIKGIEFFLTLVEQMSAFRPVRATLLGTVTRTWQARIELVRSKLASRGSSLATPGFVTDIAPFLGDARILLLPITDPHFSRPAVEAGLCGRTFVVSQLPGLEDFADPEVNCLAAPPRDTEAWLAACMRLLDDDDKRHTLAAANRAHALTRFSLTAFDTAWQQITKTCG